MKKIISILTIFTLLLSLAACSSSKINSKNLSNVVSKMVTFKESSWLGTKDKSYYVTPIISVYTSKTSEKAQKPDYVFIPNRKYNSFKALVTDKYLRGEILKNGSIKKAVSKSKYMNYGFSVMAFTKDEIQKASKSKGTNLLDWLSELSFNFAKENTPYVKLIPISGIKSAAQDLGNTYDAKAKNLAVLMYLNENGVLSAGTRNISTKELLWRSSAELVYGRSLYKQIEQGSNDLRDKKGYNKKIRSAASKKTTKEYFMMKNLDSNGEHQSVVNITLTFMNAPTHILNDYIPIIGVIPNVQTIPTNSIIYEPIQVYDLSNFN